MTVDQALQINTFAKTWICKVIAPGNHWKRIKYRRELCEAIDDFIPVSIEDYDPYGILDAKNWDNGTKTEWGWSSGLGDIITENIEWENIYDFTEKGKSDFTCSIRIAVDLFIKQSGGVVGFTIGDLRSAFDGKIPNHITSLFDGDVQSAKDHESIWL